MKCEKVRGSPFIWNGHGTIDKEWLFYIFKNKKGTQDKIRTRDNKTSYINKHLKPFNDIRIFGEILMTLSIIKKNILTWNWQNCFSYISVFYSLSYVLQ